MKLNYFIFKKVVENRPIVEQFPLTLDDLRDGLHPDEVKKTCECCFLDINIENEPLDITTNQELLDLTILLDISLETLEEIIEDSRPRLDDYLTYMLILFKSVQQHPHERDEKTEHQIGMIVYENVIITLHMNQILNVDQLFSKFRKNPLKLIRGKGTYMVTRYFDTLIDQTIDVIDDWRMFADEIEKAILGNRISDSEETLSVLIGIRESIFDTIKILQADREVVSAMQDAKLSDFNPAFIPRELDDHIRHEIDELDILRQVISDLMNLYYNQESSKINKTMARFTFAAALLLFPTLISGIFGMNNVGFPSIPFWAVLILIVGSMGVVWLLFRLKKFI
ncbi:MAG: magnesium transporter CorA family protein [Promethearchaeota archaeon]